MIIFWIYWIKILKLIPPKMNITCFFFFTVTAKKFYITGWFSLSSHQAILTQEIKDPVSMRISSTMR